jgi:hypothetical protein
MDRAGRVEVKSTQATAPEQPRRRERLAGTLAPVGLQGPPAHRAAGLVAVAARPRGSLLWTIGTSCVCARNRRSCKKDTACHNRAPSRQSSGTQHLRRGTFDVVLCPSRLVSVRSASRDEAIPTGRGLRPRRSRTPVRPVLSGRDQGSPTPAMTPTHPLRVRGCPYRYRYSATVAIIRLSVPQVRTVGREPSSPP